MKIILLLIGSFAFIAAKKSQGNNGKINNDQFDQHFFIKDAAAAPAVVIATAAPPATYKLLFETGKGKVYESPVDKMKCLASDFPSGMPVAGVLKSEPERIPNPMLNNPALLKPLK